MDEDIKFQTCLNETIEILREAKSTKDERCEEFQRHAPKEAAANRIREKIG